MGKMKSSEWLKKNGGIILFWIGFAVILLFTPRMIFKNFKEPEKLGFLGGYIGAVLTLGGVWLQIQWLGNQRKRDVKKREKERKEGILKYLKFVLNENINIGEKEGFCVLYSKKAFLSKFGSYS